MADARPGCRRWLFRSVALFCGLAVGFLAVEGAIRVFPKLLNSDLRHAAFSKYDTLPGGIFLSEGITRMRFMRADFTTRAYSHDRFWIHSTDGFGFRNPAGLRDRRVLLLGDSLTYGHGVGGDQTAAHFLRTDHSVAAYDLSAQGRCLYEHYVLARLYLEDFRPETVLLFVFANDARDLEKIRRTDLAPGLQEIDTFDYGLIRERVERLGRYREPWPARAAMGSRLVRMVAKTNGWKAPRASESSPPPDWRSRAAKVPARGIRAQAKVGVGVMGAVLDDERFAPIEAYYDRVLEDLAERCRLLGTRLVLVHLVPPVEKPWPDRDRAQVKLQATLEAIAGRIGVDLLDTSDAFAGRTEWILPGDGHFSPAGNRALANFLTNNAPL